MKRLLLLLLLAFVFACALYAAKGGKTDDTTNRIDFTAAAGEVTMLSGAGAGTAAAAQPDTEEENQDKSAGGALIKAFSASSKKTAAQRKEAVPEVPQANGFTFDLMSIARSSIDPFDLDLSFSLVFGDYGNFGIEGIYYLQFLGSDQYFGGTVGLDLAFDIFPLGNSPSGLYFGPIIGGRLYIIDSDTSNENLLFAFVPGANAGYRLDLGGFILDAGIVYGAVITFSDSVTSPINDFQFKFSIGGYYEQITPDMIKAKQQGEKPQGDKK